ncbi:MAG: hypothetical protein BEN19_06740 [Epulopiscium sp. Nuni2H_MBin003]|nr:MAG: hypothetical protein BEN19_06740 [Epulopiscium sp. Nuni2H_MBin003]
MIKNKLITPLCNDNEVAIILACNNNYIPYVISTILSIQNCSNANNQYDIIILHQDVTPKSKQLAYRILGHRENFSVRFFNVKDIVSQYNLTNYVGRISIEGYYRILIPHILNGYKRAIYIDCDIIVVEDIMQLSKVNLDGYILGACQDLAWCMEIINCLQFTQDFLEKLNITSIYKKFNSGVLLFNLENLNKYISYEILLEDAVNNNYYFGDEDILNKYYSDKTLILHPSFNVWHDSFGIFPVLKYAPKKMYDAYMEARKKPKVVHYIGYSKPWNYPNTDMAYYYWDTIRDTELYELSLKSQIVNIPMTYSKKVLKDCYNLLN